MEQSDTKILLHTGCRRCRAFKRGTHCKNKHKKPDYHFVLRPDIHAATLSAHSLADSHLETVRVARSGNLQPLPDLSSRRRYSNLPSMPSTGINRTIQVVVSRKQLYKYNVRVQVKRCTNVYTTEIRHSSERCDDSDDAKRVVETTSRDESWPIVM